MIRVLFVCMGNICRSPTAEGVFRQLVNDAELQKQIHTDSAGTHAYHLGESPDPRAVKIAFRQGIDLSDKIARRVVETDFLYFNHIFAMDRVNLMELRKFLLIQSAVEPRLLLDCAPGITETEVPDPYYGTLEDYRQVMNLIYAGTKGLLQELKRELENTEAR